MTLTNGEYSAPGVIANGKSEPQNAGFGAANAAQTMRNIQLEIRIGF